MCLTCRVTWIDATSSTVTLSADESPASPALEITSAAASPPLPPPAARVRAARRREVAAARLVEDVERVLLLEGEEIMLDTLVPRLW